LKLCHQKKQTTDAYLYAYACTSAADTSTNTHLDPVVALLLLLVLLLLLLAREDREAMVGVLLAATCRQGLQGAAAGVVVERVGRGVQL